MKKISIQEFKERYGFDTPTKGMPIDINNRDYYRTSIDLFLIPLPIKINNRDYYRTSIDPCNLYTKKQLIEKGIPLQTIIKKYDRRDVR